MTNRLRPGVLVVDDWSDVGAAVADLLTYLGYAPRVATSGASAVELVRRDPEAFAVIVMDVQMAGMDGPATLDAVRVLAPRLPCVFMCAGSGEYTVDDLLARGGFAVLRKPIPLQHLGEIVGSAVGTQSPG